MYTVLNTALVYPLFSRNLFMHFEAATTKQGLHYFCCYNKSFSTIGIKHFFHSLTFASPEGGVENRGLRKVPRELLKTEGEARGYQHLPRDLANVMNDKIMFDRYYCISSKKTYRKLRKCLRTLFFSLTTIFLRAHAFYNFPRFGLWPGTFYHNDLKA